MIFVEKTFVDAQLCCQKRPWQKCLGVTTKPQKFFSLERFLLYVQSRDIKPFLPPFYFGITHVREDTRLFVPS